VDVSFSGESTQVFRIGAASCAVPGTALGLETAHRRHGSLPWKVLFEPAIELARGGFELTRPQAYLHAILDLILRHMPEGRRIYGPDGARLAAGDRVVFADLAVTLELLADRGARELYHGDLGHYPVHFGWTLAIAMLALISSAHPQPELGGLTSLLIPAGVVQGVVRTASVLDGRTWKLILPTDVVLCAVVVARLSAIGASPIALYFLAASLAGLGSLAGWGLVHRGFPPTSKPRSARDIMTVRPDDE